MICCFCAAATLASSALNCPQKRSNSIRVDRIVGFVVAVFLLLGGTGAASAAAIAWAVVSGGAILNSTDSGATWSSQTSGTTSGLRGLSFVNATTGWAVGGQGVILNTPDGGATWSPQTSGTIEALVDVSFVSATTGWAVGLGPIGGFSTIVNTTNGGLTWTPQASGTTRDLIGVSFVNATTGWAVGGLGEIVNTTDGGLTWSIQTSGTGVTLRDVEFVNSTTGWAVGDSGTILNTTNGGATWSIQTSGTTERLHGISFVDATTGWAVGNLGTILNTTNGGATWSPQTSGTTRGLASVSFANATIGVAVGSFGKIVNTTDGGLTWLSQTSGTGFAISDIVTILEFCGDGIVNDDPNEECDDGNNVDGDGCSATCEIELGGPALSCEGFDPPLDEGPVKVKKNRVLPFKATLLDADLNIVTGFVSPPMIQVIFDSGIEFAEDVTSEALTAGKGTDGNEFELNEDDKWHFNLKTKNYRAEGTYTTTMESGDITEYVIDPICEGVFVIE